MSSALRFVESVLRTARDDFDLMIDVGNKRVAKVERAGNAVDKRYSVHRKVGLQRRALVEVVEDDERWRIALQAKHQAHLALRGFVVEFGNAFELAIVDQFLHLDDELVRAHLVRELSNHDEIGTRSFFDFGFAAKLD